MKVTPGSTPVLSLLTLGQAIVEGRQLLAEFNKNPKIFEGAVRDASSLSAELEEQAVAARKSISDSEALLETVRSEQSKLESDSFTVNKKYESATNLVKIYNQKEKDLAARISDADVFEAELNKRHQSVSSREDAAASLESDQAKEAARLNDEWKRVRAYEENLKNRAARLREQTEGL